MGRRQGYATDAPTVEIGAREVREGMVLFLGNGGTRLVVSEPYYFNGYIRLDTTWLDGQCPGRWEIRADATVLRKVLAG